MSKEKERNLPYLFLVLFLVVGSLLLINNSFSKSIFLALSFFVYGIFLVRNKDKILTTLLFCLIIFPYNITIQFPRYIRMFGKAFELYNPYASGVVVNYLIPTLSIIDIGFFLLLSSFVVTFFYKKKLKKITEPIRIYKIPLSLILLFLIVQNIYVKDFLCLFNSVRIILLIICMILLVDYVKEVKFTDKIRKTIIYLLFTNTLIQGTLGCLQFIIGRSIGLSFLGESTLLAGKQYSSFITVKDTYYLRAYGTFPHPNILACFFILVILFSFYLYLLDVKKGNFSNLLKANIILCNFFVIFTFSRIGIFLSILNTILLYLLSRRNTSKAYSVIPLLYGRITRLFSGEDNSITERIALSKVSLSIIKENLLLGCGTGCFIKNMGDNVPYSIKGVKILQPVHNIFLLILSEFGIIGFSLFMYLFVCFYRKEIKKLSKYITIIFFDILVIGSLDHYLIDLPQGLFILCCLLVLCVVEKRREWDSNP